MPGARDARIPRRAPAHPRRLSLEHELSALFSRIDARTSELAEAAGLACPPGCGRCCTSPEVETTVVECLPLARELVARGALQAVLARLRPEERTCALYEPDSGDPARGRCGMYAWRPSVCRLFGFAARGDKYGRAELVRCKVLFEHDPAAGARAAELVREQGLGARFGEVALEVASLDPQLGERLLPINVALRSALERVALAQAFARDEADGERPPLAPRPESGEEAADERPDADREPPRRPPSRPPRRPSLGPRRAA